MKSDYSEISLYVKTTECGPNDCISSAVLFANLQEAADIGAAERGFDRHDIESFNACWIVMRTRIRIYRFPKWRDTIKLRTWSTGLEKLFFGREYEVYSDDNELLVEGTSMWILADKDTHSPINPTKIEGISDTAMQNNRKVFGESCGRLKVPKREIITTEPTIIKYGDFSELDHNNHVNNTRYIAWMCDALSKHGYDPQKLNDISINYISEVHYGERVEIFVDDSSDKILIYGYKEGNIAVFCTEVSLS